MPERFRAGDLVRAAHGDPSHHTRLPRYVRGAVGTVVELEGRHPLADDRASGRAGEDHPVYLVRFSAAELFGAGEHTVAMELWESYLSPPGAPGSCR